MIATTRRWPRRADGSNRRRGGSAASSATSWSSTPPSARYVWEVPYYPQYYIPLADVRTEFLRDENHPQKVQFGPSRLHSLVGAGRRTSRRRGCSTTVTAPSPGWCASNGIALRWFEEDEPIYGHPRNPYARVDALRSHRHVTRRTRRRRARRHRRPGAALRNRLADKVLHRPDRRRLRASRAELDAQTLCPYKGRRRATGRCGSATRCTRTWPGRITTRCRPSRRSRAWSRSTTRSSTSSSTVSRWRGRRRTSAERYSTLRSRRRSALPLDDRDRVAPRS